MHVFFRCVDQFGDFVLMSSFIMFVYHGDQLDEPIGSSGSPPFHCSMSFVTLTCSWEIKYDDCVLGYCTA